MNAGVIGVEVTMVVAAVKAAAKAASSRKKLSVKKGPTPKEKTSSSVPTVASPSAPGRKLFRRNSRDQAERAISRKLFMFPESQVQNNKDEFDKDILEKVVLAIKKTRKEKSHVKASFWSELIVDHRLCGTLPDQLLPPTGKERVRMCLNEAMALAHEANPAKRSCQKLLHALRFLQPPVSRTEVFGLIKGTWESPSLSKAMARTCQEALLKTVAKLRLHEAEPDYWQVISGHYDALLASMWQKAQSSGVSRTAFLRGNRDTLSIYLCMETACRVEAAIKDGEEVSGRDIDTLCRSSMCGSELFAAESLRAEMTNYIKDVEARIYELECAIFLPDEISSFKKVCNVLAESLDSEVWAEYDGTSMDVPFLTTTVKAVTAHPSDHWANRYEARLKTLVVGSGKVPMYLHEEWLFGANKIEGVPQEVQIPADIYYDIANCREFMLERLGNGWMTLSTIKKVMRDNAEEATKLNESYWLDLYFVNECYEGLITSHMEKCMLALCPSPTEVRSLAKAVAAAKILTNGDIVMAMEDQLKKSLGRAASLLQDVLDGHGPSAQEALRLSPWMLRFLKNVENFARFSKDENEEKDTKIKKNKLVGAEAVSGKFESLVKAGGVPDGSDLKFFRAYRWLLSPEQETTLEMWHRQSVASAKDRMSATKAKAIKNIDDAEKENKKRKKKDDASKPAQAIVAPPLAPVNVLKLDKEEKEDCREANLEDATDYEEATSSAGGLMPFFGALAM